MDWNTVKTLKIPEGDVIKVNGKDGVLWQYKREFRYLKLKIDAIKDDTVPTVQLAEVEFIDKSNNLFTWGNNTVVTATIEAASTSTGRPPKTPDMLIDGSTETKFCSAKYVPGFHILFDLSDKPVDVYKYNRWRYYTANDSPVRDPITFTLYGSNNNVDFEVLDSVTNATVTDERFAVAYTGQIKN